MRKSKMMRAVEEQLGQPLEDYLPRAVTELGQVGVCEITGVDKGTLKYWLMKFGIRVERIALGPGDTITINRALPRNGRRAE